MAEQPQNSNTRGRTTPAKHPLCCPRGTPIAYGGGAVLLPVSAPVSCRIGTIRQEHYRASRPEASTRTGSASTTARSPSRLELHRH
jgi:hypothetical protein